MSVRWITWAWEQECGSAGEKLTLIALADHAGETGECWPSNGRLAEKTNQGVSTVRGHIKNLEDAGLLRREERQRPNGSQTSSLITLGAPPESSTPPARIQHPPRQISAGQEEPSLEPSVEPEDPPTPPASGGAVEKLSDFAIFWARYPRKVGRPAAEKAYLKARRKMSTDAPVLIGLEAWTIYWEARNEPEFIPHASTWLNQERWNDSPPPLPKAKAPAARLSSGAGALQRYIERNS